MDTSLSQERPGDVAVLGYVNALYTLCIDVSVVRIMCPTYHAAAARHPGLAIEQVEGRKWTQYEDSCKANNVHFVPFVTDEYGDLGAHAKVFLKDLAEKAVSKHTDDYRDGQTPEARQATLVSRWRRYITCTQDHRGHNRDAGYRRARLKRPGNCHF